MLVPYPVRVALWAGVLALLVWGWFRLDGALEQHYTAESKLAVAEDAARANAIALDVEKRRGERTAQLLKQREARIAALQRKGEEQDDEMARLKADQPEVQQWATTAVPAAVRARHGLR